jgi:DUF971 family protein
MTRWPTELKLAKDKKGLTIAFEDGVSHTLSAEYLRVMSPISARRWAARRMS